MDTGHVTSLDGLAATTSLVPDAGDEPMDVSSIQKILCYTCRGEGHMSAGCSKRYGNYMPKHNTHKRYSSNYNKDLSTGQRTSTSRQRLPSRRQGLPHLNQELNFIPPQKPPVRGDSQNVGFVIQGVTPPMIVGRKIITNYIKAIEEGD